MRVICHGLALVGFAFVLAWSVPADAGSGANGAVEARGGSVLGREGLYQGRVWVGLGSRKTAIARDVPRQPARGVG